jgi:hypothetical protein
VNYKRRVSDLESEIEELKKTSSKSKSRKKKEEEPKSPVKKSPAKPKANFAHMLQDTKSTKVNGDTTDKAKSELTEEKDRSASRDPLKALDEETSAEKDSRLIINRKPKTAPAKENKGFGFSTLVICSGCSLIVKKGDKSVNCGSCSCKIGMVG